VRPALFVDRDGTIIRDVGYPRDPALVEPLAGAAPALRRARELGYAIVIVSNQSGVARGLIRPEEARAVQDRVAEVFAAEGVVFDGVFFCLHGPDDGCACRKPRPGMLLEAARELGLDLGASLMIGDKPADLEAGRAAGTAAIAIETSGRWDAIVAWLAAHRAPAP